ncbi:hypothetical protein [Streptomyces anandii]|uniref:hypothetical protein n=1 Tax=Streptomyces anandii TaxID=285454 RepID=UPI0037B0DD78
MAKTTPTSPPPGSGDVPEQPDLGHIETGPAVDAGRTGEADAPEQQPPGVYEYVHGVGCVYPHVPLTCHAYQPRVPETETSPEIPERPATVFEWLDGPPADGRWVKTRKKPNQAADNAGGLLTSKE